MLFQAFHVVSFLRIAEKSPLAGFLIRWLKVRVLPGVLPIRPSPNHPFLMKRNRYANDPGLEGNERRPVAAERAGGERKRGHGRAQRGREGRASTGDSRHPRHSSSRPSINSSSEESLSIESPQESKGPSGDRDGRETPEGRQPKASTPLSYLAPSPIHGV